jgi:hypothetical protein
MNDPTGTIGIAPRVQSDMDVALGGGPDFLARLKQLGDARDAAAKAQAELRLGEAAKSAFEKAEQMKAAAEDAYIKAGQDVFDSTRKVEEARAQAKDILADAAARSADADKRLAAAEQAEQEVMKERAVVRAAERAAATTKREYETRRAGLSAKIDRLVAELSA